MVRNKKIIYEQYNMYLTINPPKSNVDVTTF
jgi:hypothetical protein